MGDVVPKRDSAARLVPRGEEAVPGFCDVLGCRAFGLEETGELPAAESAGLRAVEMNVHDIWAGHAVAHVFETAGRPRDGIAWIDRHEDAWREHGVFARHLLWHRCLYHLELGEREAVLDRFDRLIWAPPSEDNLDLVNAASLLMRLEMVGVDVGRRWETVAEYGVRRIGFHNRPFNDVHLMMAMVRGGRHAPAKQMIAEMRDHAERGQGTVAPFIREVGVPLSAPIVPWGDRPFGPSVALKPHP